MTRLPLLLALLSLTALADVPPANSIGCREKSAGAACKTDDGSDGVCVTATCSRNDYSEGVPPKTVTYDCLRCDTAPAPPADQKKGSCAAVPAGSLATLGLLLLGRRRRAAR